MDYITLQTTLLARLSMGSTDPLAANAPSLVNEGLHVVEVAHPRGWPWLRDVTTVNTSTTVSYIAFASINSGNCARVLDVRILSGTEYFPLEEIGVDEADQVDTSTSAGFPAWYHVEGQKVYLHPAPDAVYSTKIHYIATEPDLTGDTSTPVMPTRFHTSIVTAALSIYYDQLQDSNRTAVAEAKLEKWLERMMKSSHESSGKTRVNVRTW